MIAPDYRTIPKRNGSATPVAWRLKDARLRDPAALLLLACGFGAVFMTRNSLGFLAPFMTEDMGLNPERLGWLAAAFSFAWAFAGFAITTLAMWLPQRMLLAGLLCALGLSSIGASLSSGFASFCIARLASGLCSGPVAVLSEAYAAQLGSVTRRGLRVGLLDGLGGGVLGTVLAPVILVAVTLHSSWRAAFLVASGIAIVSAALLARTLKPNSADEVRHEGDVLETAAGIGRADISTDPRTLVLCCLICTAMIGWLILTSTFYPTYLISVLHRSETEMTLLMSVMGTGSLAATFLIPTLSDHFGRRRVMMACYILAAVGPIALLLAPESFSAILVAMALGGLAAGTFPLFLAVIPAESVSAQRLPWTIGIIQACGELGGGVLMPAVAGWAAVHVEPAAPVQMALGATLIASLFSFALNPRPGNS